MIYENSRTGERCGTFTLADGKEYLFSSDKPIYLRTVKDVYDEDWKTALSNGNPHIPKGEVVRLEDFFCNCYGEFFSIRYNGYLFYAKPCEFTFERDKIIVYTA